MNLAVCSATSEQAISVAKLAGSLHMPASSKTDNEEKQCFDETQGQKESGLNTVFFLPSLYPTLLTADTLNCNTDYLNSQSQLLNIFLTELVKV